jgi:hypothetical protein
MAKTQLKDDGHDGSCYEEEEVVKRKGYAAEERDKPLEYMRHRHGFILCAPNKLYEITKDK